jgi:hypothetical protein
VEAEIQRKYKGRPKQAEAAFLKAMKENPDLIYQVAKELVSEERKKAQH